MAKKYVKKALEKRTVLNDFNTQDYDKSMDEFICVISSLIPAKYGNEFAKKVCYDSKNTMVEVSTAEDRGDCRIGKSKYAELKISFANKDDKYNIRNIRGWQDFDYYILCFVNEKLKAKYYCVNKEVITNNSIFNLSYMNGTAESNRNNDKVGMSLTINGFEINWHFKYENLLGGTSYKHLLKFIANLKNVMPKISPKIEEIMIPSNRKYRPSSELSFMYKGMEIKGVTNKDTMFNLVKTIGPKKLDGIIWKSQLSKEKKPLHEYVGDGYYFNPKFSLRDTLLTIRMINEKTNLNIQIINNK
jgi:hypothetical protein